MRKCRLGGTPVIRAPKKFSSVSCLEQVVVAAKAELGASYEQLNLCLQQANQPSLLAAQLWPKVKLALAVQVLRCMTTRPPTRFARNVENMETCTWAWVLVEKLSSALATC